MHTVDYHLGLLEPLGIRNPSQKLRLDLPAAAMQKAAQLPSANGVHGDFVLLHPGSAREEKFWEADRWAAMIDFAAQSWPNVCCQRWRAAIEQEHIAEIRRQTRTPFLDLSRKMDLLTLAAVIKRARLVVTVDSAPVHLAAATQTPQVALFGPTNPLHWHPRFAPAIILQAGEAKPLTQFSPNQKPTPMNLISTQAVIDAMDALLATPAVAIRMSADKAPKVKRSIWRDNQSGFRSLPAPLWLRQAVQVAFHLRRHLRISVRRHQRISPDRSR